ncbi:MAG: hypothetical protein OXU61_00475 [Gammaproteobacteria bacterium]|nr:hypothetical protein [Gammaproteobacteria bacterium]
MPPITKFFCTTLLSSSARRRLSVVMRSQHALARPIRPPPRARQPRQI